MADAVFRRTGLDLDCRYTATANDGKLTEAKDWVTGEVTGTPTYDVANRLVGVAGESYRYGADNRRVWWKTAGGVERLMGTGIDGHWNGLWFGGG